MRGLTGGNIKNLKLFSEILGMLIVRKYWPEYSIGFFKSERPDWINLISSVGIEITRDLSKHEGYTNYFSETYFGKTKKDIPQKEYKDYLGQLYFKDNDGPLYALSPTKGLVDSSFYHTQLVQCFTKKTSKLQKYKSTSKNALFIFHSFSLNENEIKALLPIFTWKSNRYFQTVFIDANDQLITYNIDKQTIIVDMILKDIKKLIIQAEEITSYSCTNRKIQNFEELIKYSTSAMNS